MTAATFILMHKDQPDAKKAQEIIKFFKWSYTQGKAAEELDYIPMPKKVVSMVNDTWKQSLKTNNQAIIK